MIKLRSVIFVSLIIYFIIYSLWTELWKLDPILDQKFYLLYFDFFLIILSTVNHSILPWIVYTPLVLSISNYFCIFKIDVSGVLYVTAVFNFFLVYIVLYVTNIHSLLTICFIWPTKRFLLHKILFFLIKVVFIVSIFKIL